MASCTVTGNYGGAGGSTTYYGIVVGPNTAVSGGQTANNLALSHIDFLFVRSGFLLQPGSINVARKRVTMQLPANQFSTGFVITAKSQNELTIQVVTDNNGGLTNQIKWNLSFGGTHYQYFPH